MKVNWKLFSAVATMTGTIVGAGFLGIPYVVAKSGLLIGIAEIILIGVILLLIELYLGEILLRTRETHQLPGLAKIYLGKWGYRLMFFSMFFGLYSALIAYLIGEGESLSYIFTGTLNYTLYFALGFWLLISIFVYHGIRALKKGESIGLIVVSGILLLVIALYSGRIQAQNLFSLDLKNALLPLGVIMFAFLGFSSLPEVLRGLRRNEKLMKKAVIIGSIIPIIIYSIFTFVVVGFSGAATPEIATFALSKIFVLLPIFTMFTAFFAISLAMRDIYLFDLNYGRFKAWILSCLVSLILFLVVYLSKVASFIQILEICGIVCGGLNGILILMMVKRARKVGKRKPEYKVKLPSWIIFVLMIVLIAGMLFQLIR